MKSHLFLALSLFFVVHESTAFTYECVQDPCAGLCYDFTSTYPLGTTTNWDFGDGTTDSSTTTVRHCYTNVDTYVGTNAMASVTATALGQQPQTSVVDHNLCKKGVFIGATNGTTLTNLTAYSVMPGASFFGNGNTKLVYVYAPVDIDKDFIFEEVNIYFLPGAGLNTSIPTVDLQIGETSMLAAPPNCNCLWRGILMSGGSLSTYNHVTIRDALYGIAIRNYQNLDIRNTQFLDNYIGLTAHGSNFNFDFVLSSCTFSSSDNLHTWCSGGSGGFYDAPFQPSGDTFSTERGWAGIYLSGTISQFIGQSPGGNLFNRLANGIVLQNSSVGTMTAPGGPVTDGIRNCRFLNMRRGNYPVAVGGHGIFFNAPSSSGRFMRQVGNGLGTLFNANFINCEVGVYAKSTSFAAAPSVTVTNNTMLQMESGVWIESLAGAVRANVTNNTINSNTYYGHGVFNGVPAPRGIHVQYGQNSSNTNINITGNNVTSNFAVNSWVVQGIDVYGVASGVFGEEVVTIDDNIVSIPNYGNAIYAGVVPHILINNNDVSNPSNAFFSRGITISSSPNATISCNEATGPVGDSDNGNTSQVGISVLGSPQVQVVDNHVTNYDRGMVFDFNNGSANIACNDFLGTNWHGLYVTGDIGNQPDKGNFWDCFSLSMGQVEANSPAYNFTGEAFTAQQNTDYFPDAHDPPAFYVNSTNPTPICPTNPSCDLVVAVSELTNPEIMVAQGQSLGGYGGWTQGVKATLYRKLKENPGQLTGNLLMQGFLSTEANTPIGKFYELREDIAALPQTAPMERAQLEANLATLLNTVGEMRDIAAQLATDPAEPLYSQLVAAYNAHAESLEALAEANSVLLVAIEAAQVDMADDLLATLDGINTVQPWEAYEKEVLGIFLATVAKGNAEATTAQLEALEEIAAVCPNEGGWATIEAIHLYAVLTGEQLEVAECGLEEREGNTPNFAKPNTSLTLSPNPTNGMANASYRLPEGELGLIRVLDAQGRSVSIVNLENNMGKICLPYLPKGVYIVQLFTNDSLREQSKLIQF